MYDPKLLKIPMLIAYVLVASRALEGVQTLNLPETRKLSAIKTCTWKPALNHFLGRIAPGSYSSLHTTNLTSDILTKTKFFM